MKKWLLTLFVLMSGLVVLSTCTESDERAIGQEASLFVEMVERGESEFFTVPFDRYKTEMKELPIGVFDSGIGGLTVLTAILQLDAFDNVTHESGPDGRPDFEHERFVYLGDQANMPYGNYASEQKTDFLRELILKDAVFLLGGRYWPSATAQMPRNDKPPVKAIVIACNTATAYGLEAVSAALKEWQLPVQVVGIIDVGAAGAVQAFTEQNKKGVVAVLATVGTCRSEGYVRAIAQQAHQAGIMPPTVIQQGCLGFAGAVEGDQSYISLAEGAQTVDYRGPAVGNQIAPIDPGLIAQYNFEAEGLLGDLGRPATWRLNSVENYIRYHTATLLERHRQSDCSEPISTVVLGCTHFPYYTGEIAKSLERLRDFREPNGDEPYRNLILEQPSFIDPAELTARQFYETLAGLGLLTDKSDESVLSVDEFYISMPNASLPGLKLTDRGGFTYEYKYGRVPGNFELEYVKRVPMSSVNLSLAVRERIKTRMPVVWNRLVAFSQKSPRTRDLPDSARIMPSPDN
jgi:glutamate racemase